ncbi:MAG: STELLO glycosyltransferase family protein [Akkermansia sp.]
MNTSIFCVVTSIQAPTSAIIQLNDKLIENKISFILVGDRKGPMEYPQWADFLSIDHQYNLPFALSKLLPEKHYARKNLGYLRALSQGAQVIYETDDDNAPEKSWQLYCSDHVKAELVGKSQWANIYQSFTDENVWPRGLSLQFINEPYSLLGNGDYYSPIRQGLANGSPDVDAIWRLSMDKEIIFKERDAVVLDKNTWCPFNSQNTWWSKEVFPLMYLPSFVSFRMTDIWRSFIAQRCVWAIGGKISFHIADVYQERNAHYLMKDFEDEIPGYMNNDRIAQVLQETDLLEGRENVSQNLLTCYKKLVEIGIVPDKEIPLVEAWIRDCSQWM